MKTKTLALMTALAAVCLPHAAFAFDPDRSADVLSRPRPEFDARGVRVGSFMLFPSIAAGVAYQDNVFNVADAFAPQEDFLFTLTPELQLNSDWGRHALNLHAQSRSYFYQDFSSEDRTDWKVGGDARLDIFGGTNLTIDGVYEELTEPRSTDPTFASPLFDQTESSHWGVGAGLNHISGRFRGALGARYDEYDYDDIAGPLPAGNTSAECPNGTIVPAFQGAGVKICNNDDRDRATIEAFAKLGFSVSPGYSLFVRGKYNDRDYNSANPWDFPPAGQPPGLELSDNNRNLDSQGWGADLGIDFELARLLHGEAYIGYVSQEYDAHPFDPTLSFADTDSFAFGADLKWYATMLTTVSLGAKRSIEDTVDTFTVASGAISDRYNLRVDHEMMRNLVIYGRIGFGQDDFQQSALNRQDDLLTGGIGAIFMINNNLHMSAGYDFVDRDSNVALFDYSNNAFQLTLTGKL